MKKILSTALKILAILAGGIGIGWLLMVLVYTIPTDKLIDNAESGAKKQYNTDDSFSSKSKWCQTYRDPFTDSLMISTVICDSKEDVINRAMKNQRIEYESVNAYNSLMRYYGIDIDESDGIDVQKYEEYRTYSYARYWNGYLVVLKPLLAVFDYNVIIILNYIMQGLLILFVVLLLIKRKKGWYAVPFLFMIISICPYATAGCMQYSNVMYIMLITVLLMLIFKEKFEKNNRYLYLFLINGMLVNYFDLLTYPLLALGIPLVVYLILEDNGLKDNIFKIIEYSAIWVTAYGVMWISKWIIASLLTNQNVVKNAIETMKYRSGNKFNLFCDGVISDSSFGKVDINVVYDIGYKDVLVRNFYAYCYVYTVAAFIILFVLAVYMVYDSRKKINKGLIKSILPFLFISAYPFIWYYFLSNHSFGHYYYTSKLLAVAAFGILCMLTKVWRDAVENENNNGEKEESIEETID